MRYFPVAAAALALLVAACGSSGGGGSSGSSSGKPTASAPGITATSVTVGGHFPLTGPAAPGYSADQATAALEEVFKQTMPREMGFDYSGISYQEQKAREGVPASVVFGLSLLFVFLILAALY